MIILIYFLGFMTVWTIDKLAEREQTWFSTMSRVAISLLSWASVLIYAFVRLSEEIGYYYESKGKTPPKWL